MRYLIANWKMNLPPEGITTYVENVSRAGAKDVTVVIAPPFPYLKEIAFRGQGAGGRGQENANATVSSSPAPSALRSALSVGGQNCSEHPSGALTGEVAPSMLRDCGATYVILGHSERRTLFHESDAVVARKLALAIEGGLTPVLCIGEDLKTRDAGHVARHLAEQIKATAIDQLERAGQIVIAYEPIWAIGTGRNASGALCAETLFDVRNALERFWPAKWRRTPVLYGGSVTPDNVDDLVANGTIDGFLVGGASLSSEKFLAILEGMGNG